ncbi:HAD family hydrolase [Radiobacillus deserti]|uniref:HAD family hydrolase n=1 Tax=Radiobacillus deserti TaxID=2594883 RepID=A0A516KFZ2_9BACI|nr:HAD family hydrolase [Radiobacillus deserti]QDP40269.1 HAD family hydrolase [Radiobacillus deserti]
MTSVIFDMDGTLFQTEKILQIALEDTFEHLRSRNKWEAPTPIDTYRDIMGVPLPKVWETLLPNHSIEERKQTDAYFLERLIVNIRDGKGGLYPNAIELLQYLKERNCSIYIASNGLVKYLHAIVDYYKLDQWITETFSIQHIQSLNKSDLVNHIMEKYDFSDGVVVGDRLSDIRAAKDNGLLSIGCNFDFAREDELAQADIIIDDLKEIQTVLPRLNR